MMRHNKAMMTFKKHINAFIFIGLLAMTNNSVAADKSDESWYQIEVLVYEPINQPIAGETWSAIESETPAKPAINLSAVSETKNAFQQLPAEALTLTETANKLVASGRYRIITLKAWQQPVKQRHEAESVRLSDKQTNISEPVVMQNGEIVLNPPQTDTDISDTTPQEAPARIDGIVTVSLSRYLHMALSLRYYNPDVYLAEQIALQKPDEVLIDSFMMKQSRRMRSKEVHVFDHPYFGVIATITPVERDITN